ncbi:hypothetical protein VISI1226_11871 [Vibrio sinaloensis DSM 21326]|uniref:Uncharacterized protein n=1 Tax=Vibrio sinaloensis DSM 21326 TaxID=945550 RepID=E8M3H3_PHOS4|nr:hypothetical protein [Vibrio sinaloensis]EGA71479.1 hypothetical protein VISI1226_11871 [Vibrio sinaloensis DSM 21326]
MSLVLKILLLTCLSSLTFAAKCSSPTTEVNPTIEQEGRGAVLSDADQLADVKKDIQKKLESSIVRELVQTSRQRVIVEELNRFDGSSKVREDLLGKAKVKIETHQDRVQKKLVELQRLKDIKTLSELHDVYSEFKRPRVNVIETSQVLTYSSAENSTRSINPTARSISMEDELEEVRSLMDFLRVCEDEYCKLPQALLETELAKYAHAQVLEQHKSNALQDVELIYLLQRIQTVIITLLVVAIVGTGLVLAYKQFLRDGNSKGGGNGNGTTTAIKIGSMIEINSQVIGLLVLGFSLYFFERYISSVYVIEVINHDSVLSPHSEKKTESHGTQDNVDDVVLVE